MPTLSDYSQTALVKGLMIGNSGSGKTGALACLAEAGFELKILDFDNGLDFLARHLSPEAKSRVEYEQCIDEITATPAGPVIQGQPKAFAKAMAKLDHWKRQATPQQIIVIDSLTFAGKAAFHYSSFLNPSAKDKRMIYYDAQQRIEGVVAMLYSDSFRANVIVNSHVLYIQVQEGFTKGYPTAIGQALSPQIARYFNICLYAEVVGIGAQAKRVVSTAPTGLIDVKHPAGDLPPQIPIGEAWLKVFNAMGVKAQ